jgi:hypothetical protein
MASMLQFLIAEKKLFLMKDAETLLASVILEVESVGELY